MVNNEIISISHELDILTRNVKIFPSSFCIVQNTQLLMTEIKGVKYIAAYGEGPPFYDFSGNLLKNNLKLCPLTHQNRLVINKYLDYTLPRAFGSAVPTFGTGDRLGLASPGHIRAVSKSSAKPILAQQSKRELELTGRTFEKVLDDVTFAVFQEGYKEGFGADGDHLKRESDIADALNCGYSMITLDCSEKIGRGIYSLTDNEAEKKYMALMPQIRKTLEDRYLGRTFCINGLNIEFTREELIRNVLIYYEATNFIIDIYNKYISKAGRKIDFEVSLDETDSITSKYGHFFVASETIGAGVRLNSLGPRFVGEFQKGIDYIGDCREFEKYLAVHTAIADYFGYKLSIHSGSDKFSIFNLIGKYTKGRVHIKTSGTNWLEAVGTIAQCCPALYRAIHKCALKHFEEAREYYHVSADLSKIPDIDAVPDSYLHEYLKDNNSRQLLHITYGFVLKAPDMKASIYETLRKNESNYIDRIEKHIGRHLNLVGL